MIITIMFCTLIGVMVVGILQDSRSPVLIDRLIIVAVGGFSGFMVGLLWGYLYIW